MASGFAAEARGSSIEVQHADSLLVRGFPASLRGLREDPGRTPGHDGCRGERPTFDAGRGAAARSRDHRAAGKWGGAAGSSFSVDCRHESGRQLLAARGDRERRAFVAGCGSHAHLRLDRTRERHHGLQPVLGYGGDRGRVGEDRSSHDHAARVPALSDGTGDAIPEGSRGVQVLAACRRRPRAPRRVGRRRAAPVAGTRRLALSRTPWAALRRDAPRRVGERCAAGDAPRSAPRHPRTEPAGQCAVMSWLVRAELTELALRPP